MTRRRESKTAPPNTPATTDLMDGEGRRDSALRASMSHRSDPIGGGGLGRSPVQDVHDDGHHHEHDHDHGYDHDPDHFHGDHRHPHGSILGHSHGPTTPDRLVASLALTAIILGTEIVGGILAHSLALMSDAVHMVTDVAALGLAWYAQRQADRPATAHRSYGFHRAGILAALVNAFVLLAVSAGIVVEAVRRIEHPPSEIHPAIMFAVALVALVVNLAIARYLGHGHTDDLNVRSAILHVLGDAAASAAVLLGGVVIAVRPSWLTIDPLLSMAIALIIVWGAWQVVMEAYHVLMEGTPRGLDMAALIAAIRSIEGVSDCHHFHAWTLGPGIYSMSGHVVVPDQSLSEAVRIRSRIVNLLRAQYRVDHATIQLEHERCGEDCILDPRAVAVAAPIETNHQETL